MARQQHTTHHHPKRFVVNRGPPDVGSSQSERDIAQYGERFGIKCERRGRERAEERKKNLFAMCTSGIARWAPELTLLCRVVRASLAWRKEEKKNCIKTLLGRKKKEKKRELSGIQHEPTHSLDGCEAAAEKKEEWNEKSESQAEHSRYVYSKREREEGKNRENTAEKPYTTSGRRTAVRETFGYVSSSATLKCFFFINIVLGSPYIAEAGNRYILFTSFFFLLSSSYIVLNDEFLPARAALVGFFRNIRVAISFGVGFALVLGYYYFSRFSCLLACFIFSIFFLFFLYFVAPKIHISFLPPEEWSVDDDEGEKTENRQQSFGADGRYFGVFRHAFSGRWRACECTRNIWAHQRRVKTTQH